VLPIKSNMTAKQSAGRHRLSVAVGFAVALLSSIAVTHAADTPDFNGRWTFDAGKSSNVGMMAQAQIVSTVKQTATAMMIDDHSSFGGRDVDDRIAYDLTGKPISNATAMSGSGVTVSQWNGSHLVTNWDNAKAPQKSRVEVRYLSSDGRTMLVESHRAGESVIVMAFDRSP
jgi:hypothetical protein